MSWIKICSLFAMLFCISCSTEDKRFILVDSSHSGIDFNNQITETDEFNMYEFMNIYTGGGVGIGDINNDGLEDVIFTGNQVSTQLYLNKGNLQFENITTQAGLSTDRWCTGVAMIDINNDGWMDIYLNVSGIGNTKNLLFINQKDNTFLEKASTYGLDDSSQSMQSSFFDYDRDGDLDMYLLVNPVDYTLGNVNTVSERKLNGESPSTDKLYRNNGNNTFTDISREAGILVEGYGLGVTTMDINNDGWSDIYVSNDFLTNDLLWINNQDGTFSEKSHQLLDHTSFAGMGHDVADINNDGWMDIFVADMLPEDNYRNKLLIPGASYDKFQLTQKMDYLPRYTRNTLQLNNHNGTFSEIGQLAGIDQTDWSWASLFADYDLDGDKDLLVTNGFLRDVGDLDYINYQKSNNSPFGSKSRNQVKRLQTLLELGEAKIPNYIFENQGGLHFKHNKKWGLNLPTCSNGAAIADLDHDGDLDILINNVNDKAHLYQNNTTNGHYLKIKLEGPPINRNAIGTKITVFQNGMRQHHEHQPVRGYASTVSNIVHFGIPQKKPIDSIHLAWPNAKVSRLYNQSIDTLLHVDYITMDKDSFNLENPLISNPIQTAIKSFQTDQSSGSIISDFRNQPLLPRTHEKIGAGIVVTDINADGLDDLYYNGRVWYSESDGTFSITTINDFDSNTATGAILFDMDSDGDMDLYQGIGGTQTKDYFDQVWVNENGKFIKSLTALPQFEVSTSTVIAGDYDRDGDLDIFVGGRIVPGQYPKSPPSYLLINESKNGEIKFSIDQNNKVITTGTLGMISSALWTDYDNDDDLDLIAIGEWTGIQLLENNNGVFTRNVVPKSHGWWNSINGTDIDRDGDIDYILGNMGDNHPYHIDAKHPLRLYDADFDNNGANDPILVQFNIDDYYVVPPRDKLIQQITAIRKRFPSYASYAEAPFDKSFTSDEIDKATLYEADILSNIILINNGSGNFQIKKLPVEAQRGPIMGTTFVDINDDGWKDIVMLGNNSCMEVSQGNQDALDGYYLINDQSGNFIPAPLSHNFHDDKNGIAVVKHINANGQVQIIATSLNHDIQRYTIDANLDYRTIPLNVHHVLHHFKDGSTEKVELYKGQGYLSQSGHYICIPSAATSTELVYPDGSKEILN